jgi:hypothetical protein
MRRTILRYRTSHFNNIDVYEQNQRFILTGYEDSYLRYQRYFRGYKHRRNYTEHEKEKMIPKELSKHRRANETTNMKNANKWGKNKIVDFNHFGVDNFASPSDFTEIQN